MNRPSVRPIALLVVGCAFSMMCQRRASPARDVAVEWSMTPARAVVGAPVQGEIRLSDANGRPIGGAKLRLESHMSHPGMRPVVAEVTEQREGVYEARWQFTMRGDWILLVTGTLPDGRRIDREIEVPNVQPPG